MKRKTIIAIIIVVAILLTISLFYGRMTGRVIDVNDEALIGNITNNPSVDCMHDCIVEGCDLLDSECQAENIESCENECLVDKEFFKGLFEGN